MCGIVGYISSKPCEKDRFKIFKLIKQSRIRGLHSFGLSYVKNGEIHTSKYFQNEFSKIQIPLSNALIFHNRYSTSGDFRDHKNNQPIQIGDTTMVFNGVIDMRTKSEMEIAWGVKIDSDNDGEILLRKSECNPESILQIIKEHGSYSGLIIKSIKNDIRLYAMTNGYRPLWILQDQDAIFFASTKDIFIRALGDVAPVPIKSNKLLQWKITE